MYKRIPRSRGEIITRKLKRDWGERMEQLEQIGQVGLVEKASVQKDT